jgi:hypothetical protein
MATVIGTTTVRLAKGTKEYVDVQVVDETGVVTTLVGSSAKFDTEDDTNTLIQNAVNCVVGGDGMLLQCLVDTTLSGYVVGSHYRLWVYWNIGSETPREGPFDMYIV